MPHVRARQSVNGCLREIQQSSLSARKHRSCLLACRDAKWNLALRNLFTPFHLPLVYNHREERYA